MKSNIKIASFFGLTIIIFMVIFAINYYKNINNSFSLADNKIDFVVNKGENINTIAQNLADNKIISSAFYFKLYSRLNSLSSKIKAGTYEINSSESIVKIAEQLASGDVVSREREITIVPGWNFNDIKTYLNDSNIVSKDNFKRIADLKVGNWNLVFNKPSFLDDAPATAGLEGYIFPDTYRVFKDATAEDITEKALKNFDNKLTQVMRSDISKQGKSIFEIITMASIVEKEVKSYSDMRIVSGIFWQRIENSYPLESCATLAYILGENKKQYSYEDTKIDSLYNTYKYKGLPPGPICNPGLDAIKAAIYPQKSDYHYFLTSADSGQTIFSKTYAEHLHNKAKYLQN
jgi:UPF0755 protein